MMGLIYVVWSIPNTLLNILKCLNKVYLLQIFDKNRANNFRASFLRQTIIRCWKAMYSKSTSPLHITGALGNVFSSSNC